MTIQQHPVGDEDVRATPSGQPALAVPAEPASGLVASRFDQAQYTPGPFSLHPYSTPDWQDVPAGKSHPAFRAASLAIGAGNKLVGIVQAQTGAIGYPQVDNLEEMRANHALFCAAPDLIKLVTTAISLLESAERETNWGNPTFGPSPSEEIQSALDAALARADKSS